ncbi:MAG: trimeric intracellular cation channel family protein [Elainellaceae cyanobacterium]
MAIDPPSIDAAIASQLQRISFLAYHIEASAVIAAAFSGMLAARNKRMDFVGTYIAAFVSAFGGGTLRDLLLDRRPFFWVNDQEYPILVFVLTIIFIYAPQIYIPAQALAKRLFDFVDALGLALFSISGVSYAIAFDMPNFVAVLLGVITGVFGGVLRDILLNEIPLIFRTESSLYATCSFVGCWIFLGGMALSFNPTTAAFLGCAVCVILRLISIQYQLSLPAPRYKAKPRQHDPDI